MQPKSLQTAPRVDLHPPGAQVLLLIYVPDYLEEASTRRSALELPRLR